VEPSENRYMSAVQPFCPQCWCLRFLKFISLWTLSVYAALRNPRCPWNNHVLISWLFNPGQWTILPTIPQCKECKSSVCARHFPFHSRMERLFCLLLVRLWIRLWTGTQHLWKQCPKLFDITLSFLCYSIVLYSNGESTATLISMHPCVHNLRHFYNIRCFPSEKAVLNILSYRHFSVHLLRLSLHQNWKHLQCIFSRLCPIR